ncbi:hypothetical protein PILCRDRAFT_812833 [Piloderma croceum F 1598]|uniref:Uncharacterized protein n=1 Tax=Piloderma croceum (strain F 1598) TaxID=765440 RepID=A0A0C3CJX0_PILCF|nr:hypothetical protein PILCRDRAFT_812833 [Piloderma croceum F 1598]
MSQRDWKDFLPILVDLSSILGSMLMTQSLFVVIFEVKNCSGCLITSPHFKSNKSALQYMEWHVAYGRHLPTGAAKAPPLNLKDVKYRSRCQRI